jgi:hypothetical protein
MEIDWLILIPIDLNTVGQFRLVASLRSALNLLERLSRSAQFARKLPEYARNTCILQEQEMYSGVC